MTEAFGQQQTVSAAFSRQSAVFDKLDRGNPILQWMRNRVRQHVSAIWKPGEHILELNAGTGLDAEYLAGKGFYLHATDNAEGMVAELRKKSSPNLTAERLSFHELDKLHGREFDHIFSNFGGLNCTDKLENVVKSLNGILKPGGTGTLVIMPSVCPWEILHVFKGNFKLAFRRLKKGGAASNVEGVKFTSYYYNPSRVIKMFGKGYKVIALHGLGAIVPPPYMEKFPVKYPNIFNALVSLENSFAGTWPFNRWADHFILTMQKVA